MAETEVKWVHSGGLNNKNPNEDLGGGVSVFEITENPMNNLLDDVEPEEAEAGHTSYRCFYIMNRRQDGSLLNTELTLEVNEECGVVTFGAKQANDVQTMNFVGKPIEGGFIILKTEFGPPFTVEMPFTMGGDPDWNALRSALEIGIQSTQEFSSTVAVALITTYPDPPDGASYEVTFQGDLENKRMKLIQLVQNDLVKQRGPEYRAIRHGSGYNRTGDSTIRVFPDIDLASVPAEGYLWYFNPGTGLFERAEYDSYSGDTFFLAAPLPDLGNYIDPNTGQPKIGHLGFNDEVWVELPELTGVTVLIKKKTEGSPVGQLAQMIPRETDEPTDWEDAGSTLTVGVVRPQEGFFVWIKREVASGTGGCTGSVTMTLTADVVSWPYTP